jgi:glyoxylase-like metal-dependent hydrolase (beta-lactamase superfamily II)
MQRAPWRLDRILITHSDADHIGSLPQIVRDTGADVYAPSLEVDVIEGRCPTRDGELVDEPVSVYEAVTHSDFLPILAGVSVIDTAGHTVGHTSYFVPELGLLIAGDSLINRCGLQLPPAEFTADIAQARASVTRMAALEPSIIVLGHGDPILQNAAEQLDDLARTLNCR